MTERPTLDSGVLCDDGAQFPELHILASQSGLYCFDKVLDLHALPVALPLGSTRVLSPLGLSKR